MKTWISILLVCSLLAIGCSSDKVINGRTYEPIGLLDDKDKCIRYRVVAGNIFWSIIFSETIIVPIYLIGTSIYEPVDIKPECLQKTPATI